MKKNFVTQKKKKKLDDSSLYQCIYLEQHGITGKKKVFRSRRSGFFIDVSITLNKLTPSIPPCQRGSDITPAPRVVVILYEILSVKHLLLRRCIVSTEQMVAIIL